jgi:hypothetical protein
MVVSYAHDFLQRVPRANRNCEITRKQLIALTIANSKIQQVVILY